MGKFVNPFTDVGFKIIFGQEFSKPQLLDFLNVGYIYLRIWRYWTGCRGLPRMQYSSGWQT